MNRNVLAALAAAGAVGGFVAATPASAQIQFAVFTPVPSNTGGKVNFKDNGSGVLESVTASTPTIFAFDLTPLSDFGNLSSTFDFTATQTGPATNDSGTIKTAFDGSFHYYYNGANTTVGGVTLTHGELLLGGTFANAAFSGTANASGAGLQDDGITGTVTFTSGLAAADLPLASDGQSFSIAFIDISAPLAIQGLSGDLRNFLSVGSGTFSSDLTTTGGGGGTPEPATWALMLLGFGGVGAAVRRRARAAIA